MPLVLFALAGCFSVDPASDSISAGDVAKAWPALASLAPDTAIGLAPAPGVVRMFGLPELRQVAARFQIKELPPAGVCFERRTAPLDPAALRQVLLRELPGTQLEIVDYSRAPVPQGVIEFPRAGLRAAPGGAFWYGAVRYAKTRRFAIWVRIRARFAVKRIVAAAPLKEGETLVPSMLKEATVDEFPKDGFAGSVGEAAGQVLRRPVAAGEAIRTAWLEPPKLVLRGDIVSVEVQRGGARLRLEGFAQASGAAGETIPVLNPLSHRVFRARVQSKGIVFVDEGKS